MSIWNISIAFTFAVANVIFSLTASVYSYAKIYRKLRQHQLQVHPVQQGQPNGRKVSLNIARYKKSVFSVLWVQLALGTCYIPFIVVRVVLMTYGQISESKFEIAGKIAPTFVYLNSSLNPILYCWRIGTIRQAAKDTIKQLNCCNSTQ